METIFDAQNKCKYDRMMKQDAEPPRIWVAPPISTWMSPSMAVEYKEKWEETCT